MLPMDNKVILADASVSNKCHMRNQPKHRRVSQTGVSQEIQESTQHSLHLYMSQSDLSQRDVSPAKVQTVEASATNKWTLSAV